MCAAIVGMLAIVAVPAGASTSSGRYEVQRGDTLSEIAPQLGVSVNALASANGLD